MNRAIKLFYMDTEHFLLHDENRKLKRSFGIQSNNVLSTHVCRSVGLLGAAVLERKWFLGDGWCSVKEGTKAYAGSITRQHL